MLALVLGYYYWPPLQVPLNSIAQIKARYGFLFSYVLVGCAGGLLPEILRVLFLQRGKIGRQNLLDARFGFFFWGIMGISCDALYRFLGFLVGDTPSFRVVMTKVLLDLGVYTPIWGTHAIVVAYQWRKQNFTLKALRRCLTPEFYRTHVMPTLITGWALWIPLVSVVYSLPSLLQVPIAALATSFWSLLATFMGRHAKHQAA